MHLEIWVSLRRDRTRARMRRIIGKIWRDPQFVLNAAAGDLLVSRRKPGFNATLAYATLAAV